MQFNVLFIAAILCDLALANYDVKLYKASGCTGTAGVKCPGIPAGKCCARKSEDAKKGQPPPWSLSVSANYVESGSGKANGNDKVKIYTAMGDDACSLPSAESTKCASGGSKSIAGAKVAVVIPTGSGRSSRHSRRLLKEAARASGVVEPSEYFYEEGNTEYSLPMKGLRGEEFANMTTDAARIDHLKQFGKRSMLWV